MLPTLELLGILVAFLPLAWDLAFLGLLSGATDSFCLPVSYMLKVLSLFSSYLGWFIYF